MTTTQTPTAPPVPAQVVDYARPMPPREGAPRRQVKLSFASPVIWLMLFSYAVIVVYPLFWLFYSSLKSDREIFLHPFQMPSARALHWENFSTAWVQGKFQTYFFNSVLITSTTVVVTTFLAAMTAYALSRFYFRGVKAIYFYFLAGLMIPIQLAIVPLFFELKTMGL